MIITAPEHAGEKLVAIKEAERIALKVRSGIKDTVLLYRKETVEDVSDPKRMAEYFKDIDELEKVYVRMMETILREAQNIFFSNGMSLPEYQLLYAETDSRYALGNSKAIYRTLSVRYNQNVSFLDSNKDNLLVAPERVCRTLKANHKVIQDIEDFESVFSKQREELKKEYAEALEKKIPFWKFLDEEENKHEAKEGDEVSFSTWAGQLICSFPAGGEEAI